MLMLFSEKKAICTDNTQTVVFLSLVGNFWNNSKFQKGKCCCHNNVCNKQLKTYCLPATFALNPADIQGLDKVIRNHDTLNSVKFLGLYFFRKSECGHECHILSTIRRPKQRPFKNKSFVFTEALWSIKYFHLLCIAYVQAVIQPQHHLIRKTAALNMPINKYIYLFD